MSFWKTLFYSTLINKKIKDAAILVEMEKQSKLLKKMAEKDKK